MKLRHVVILLATIALLIWLLSQQYNMDQKINVMQYQIDQMNSQINSLAEHNTIQDKLIEEAIMSVNKPDPIPVEETKVNEPKQSLPVPILVGAVETIKHWIFGY